MSGTIFQNIRTESKVFSFFSILTNFNLSKFSICACSSLSDKTAEIAAAVDKQLEPFG